MDSRDEAGRDGEGLRQTTLHHPSSTPLQLEERAARSAEFGSSLQSSRCEIADLNVRIQKLRSQILSIKSHVRKHLKAYGDLGARGHSHSVTLNTHKTWPSGPEQVYPCPLASKSRGPWPAMVAVRIV